MKRREFLVLILVLIALPIGYYLISPLLIDRAVSEAFPVPSGTGNIMDDPEISKEATQQMEIALISPPLEIEEPSPDDVESLQILLQGSFYDLAHHGSGRATIYRLADGSRVLRFEDFEVLNGPDLHVYLATQDRVANTVGVELSGAIDLGKLKGNLGDQNYPLPADLDLEAFQSVVIWCQPFRVPFNAASLGPVK